MVQNARDIFISFAHFSLFSSPFPPKKEGLNFEPVGWRASDWPYAHPSDNLPSSFLFTPALQPQRESTLQSLGLAPPLELALGILENSLLPPFSVAGGGGGLQLTRDHVDKVPCWLGVSLPKLGEHLLPLPSSPSTVPPCLPCGCYWS